MSAHRLNTRAGRRSERGAILIQVAIGGFVLLAFTMFVADMGLAFVARRQAQNVADAGALAGAIARAFDEANVNPPAANGPTERSIQTTVNAHAEYAGVTRGLTWTWVCPPSAFGGGGGTNCVTVNVFQDGSNGSARLPVFFGSIVGASDQHTRATATAQAIAANASECLRPFGVPDLWFEQNMPASPTEFNAWNTRNGKNYGDPIVPPDVYVAPTANSAGSGYNVTAHYGTPFILKTGGGGNSNPQQPGWYQPLSVPRDNKNSPTGGDVYRDNIATCNARAVTLGTKLPTETGNKAGPTTMGIGDLIALDPNARWDTATKTVINSCVTGNPSCGSYSPRTITLALYDTSDFQYRTTHNDWSGCPTGGSCVTVVNFLGFFVDRIVSGDVYGYLVRAPGILKSGAPTIGPGSSFLTSISLVR